jgi:hypothetical protein
MASDCNSRPTSGVPLLHWETRGLIPRQSKNWRERYWPCWLVGASDGIAHAEFRTINLSVTFAPYLCTL